MRHMKIKGKNAVIYLLIVFIIVSFFSSTAVIVLEAKSKGTDYTVCQEFRITMDGDVYQTQAYIAEKQDEVYITIVAAQKLLGKKPSSTIKIQGTAYTELKKYAKECRVEFYEFDPVLEAAYIWTKQYDSFSDADRIKFYQLGTPSNKEITYRQFFQLLDKTVKAADPAKLKKWKSLLKGARTSERKMSRLEGMMAVLYAATTLGSEYSEFNTDWGERNDEIGDGYEKEIHRLEKKTNPYRYIKNPYPYNLGGFKNSEYVYDGWDAEGVAVRFGYGRLSLLNHKTLFDYDENAKSMHLDSMLTYSDALKALSRFLDSVDKKEGYIPLSDKKVENYNKSIITEDLLKQAKQMPEIKGGDVSGWNGFVLNAVYENRTIDTSQFETDVKNMSQWGFSCVRYMITYQSLFDKNVTKVDADKLEELDRLIEVAIQYNIHLKLVTFTLPGRWADTDSSTYTSTGEFDLFLNEERQKEACEVWDFIAKRYRNIPSSVLSYCPIWETLNYDLSTGLPAESYTPEQAAYVYEKLVGIIKKYTSDRVVIYEATPCNEADTLIQESEFLKKTLEDNYENVQTISNFCENPYVYAEMTAVEGEHIDNNNHSMFKPEYPTTIYAVKRNLQPGETLQLDGELPEGAVLNLYLSKTGGDGILKITGDGKELYSGQLSTGEYKVESPLSGFYPYAESEKSISITLKEAFKNLTIEYSGDWLEWSGIDFTLPKSYEVERWWNTSSYDLFLAGEKESLEAITPKLKATSKIIISPNNDEEGDKITIRPDVSFTTNSIFTQANKETINAWGSKVSSFAKNSLVRCESASFCIGTDLKSAKAYYKDFLDMCSQNHLGWLLNDYDAIIAKEAGFAKFKFGGAKPVKYGENYLLADLLKLYQSYTEEAEKI